MKKGQIVRVDKEKYLNSVNVSTFVVTLANNIANLSSDPILSKMMKTYHFFK